MENISRNIDVQAGPGPKKKKKVLLAFQQYLHVDFISSEQTKPIGGVSHS
jgi:hypothetical protein